MGPLLNALDSYLGENPSDHTAGLLRAVDDRYFKRIEAIEYTVKHDDGKTLRDLDQADIILVGISRTSKTPLSIFLSHKGWKVANVPLVLTCRRLKNSSKLINGALSVLRSIPRLSLAFLWQKRLRGNSAKIRAATTRASRTSSKKSTSRARSSNKTANGRCLTSPTALSRKPPRRSSASSRLASIFPTPQILWRKLLIRRRFWPEAESNLRPVLFRKLGQPLKPN